MARVLRTVACFDANSLQHRHAISGKGPADVISTSYTSAQDRSPGAPHPRKGLSLKGRYPHVPRFDFRRAPSRMRREVAVTAEELPVRPLRRRTYIRRPPQIVDAKGWTQCQGD